MTSREYILVFSDDSTEFPFGRTTRQVFDVLDFGDSAYALDSNIIFISTEKNIEALTEKIRASRIGGEHFFVADIGDTSRAGNMTPKFWDFLRSKDALTSAA